MKKNIVEKLAELEHKQWIHWSKNIAKTEPDISLERKERWKKLWIPYSELSEKYKIQDRVWAKKVLYLISCYYILYPRINLKNKE